MNRQIKNDKSESAKFIKSIVLKRKRQSEKDVAVEIIQGLFYNALYEFIFGISTLQNFNTLNLHSV